MDFLLQGQLSVGIFGNLMSVRSRAWCGTLLLFKKKREKKFLLLFMSQAHCVSRNELTGMRV